MALTRTDGSQRPGTTSTPSGHLSQMLRSLTVPGMGSRRAGTAAVALGVVLLVDVLRVFLPSVITVFGRAAETPAELLGAFALVWFVLPLGAPVLARWAGGGRVLL